jgi:hypothetical protein
MNTPSGDVLIKALRPYLFLALEIRSKAVLALSDLHFGNKSPLFLNWFQLPIIAFN